jgi:hypothetical protein
MFQLLLGVLFAIVLGLQIYVRTTKHCLPPATAEEITKSKSAQPSTAEELQYAAMVKRFQYTWLAIYYVVVGGDWLMGPYLYALYEQHGYTRADMALFYLVGFASSTLLGTFFGSLTDRLYDTGVHVMQVPL